MSTIGNTALTLSDLAKRKDPDGKIADIIEALNEDNELTKDMPFVEGNQTTGNLTTVRTGLPQVYFRKINKGVPKSKSTSKQILEATAMIHAWSKVDEYLVRISNDPAEFRWSEDLAFLEAMKQKLETALFYGDSTVNPEQFMGLHARFSTPSNNKKQAGYHLIDGGGTGADNTSIWLIGWGPRTVHGIYPKGSKAGLIHNNEGLQIVQDDDGNDYKAYVSHFEWDVGISVRDWKSVVRICNIDVSDLTADATAGLNLINAMIKASRLVKGGKAVWYVSPKIKTYLQLQTVNKNNVNLTIHDVAGEEVMKFSRKPVRESDGILETEAQITGTFYGH